MLIGRIFDANEFTATSKPSATYKSRDEVYFSPWVKNLFFLPVRKYSTFSGAIGFEYFNVNLNDCKFYINELDVFGNVISINPTSGGALPAAVGTYSGIIQGNYTDLNGYTSAIGILLDLSTVTLPQFFSFTFELIGTGANVVYNTEFFKSTVCSEYVLIGAKNNQSIAFNQDTGGVANYDNNLPSTDILDRGIFTGSPVGGGTLTASASLRYQYSFIVLEGEIVESKPVFEKKIASDLINITMSAKVTQVKEFQMFVPVPTWVRNEILAICAGSKAIVIQNGIVDGFIEKPHQIFTAKCNPEIIAKGFSFFELNLTFEGAGINQYPHS